MGASLDFCDELRGYMELARFNINVNRADLAHITLRGQG